jgi:glycosyltransferase involved in cell wall biosynthesis
VDIHESHPFFNTSMSHQQLSAVIITFNEEKNIARCIESVKEIADEIIVLDSYSTDRTIDIAQKLGAMVHQQPFAGYIEQKNAALGLAKYDYVLSLDADEALDNAALQSIKSEKDNFSVPAYTINRCTNYCGRFIRHGSWYPDTKLRLFDKRISRWGGVNPHDRIEVQKPFVSKHLKGDILHYSYHSISEHILQNNKFSTLTAEALHRRGKKTSKWNMIINPSWAFMLSYFFRAGFLDGVEGFVIAVNIAHLSFLKHAKLYRLQKNK